MLLAYQRSIVPRADRSFVLTLPLGSRQYEGVAGVLTVAVVAVYLAFGLAALPRFRSEYGASSAPLLIILFLLGPFAFVFGDLVVNVTRRLSARARWSRNRGAGSQGC